MTKLADAMGKPPAQVALNWVRQQDPRIIALVGARSERQMRENLGALDWRLTPEQFAQLDEASRVPAGFPQAFLADDDVIQLIFGTTHPLIEARR